jgi:hypothetical protein
MSILLLVVLVLAAVFLALRLKSFVIGGLLVGGTVLVAGLIYAAVGDPLFWLSLLTGTAAAGVLIWWARRGLPSG